MSVRRVTLSGYYGFGNAGDEAVLAGLVQGLRARRAPDELDIVALSMRPSETEATHGVRAAHRYRAAALLRALARTDLLLSGGGSLLQDVTSAHGIFYYLGVVRLAQLMGRKTMFIAQGIGPLRRPRSRKLVAAVANRLSAVTVRDEASAALLRALGVTRPPIDVTADPALLLAPTQAEAAPKGEWVGVALRLWNNDHALAVTVAEACRQAFPEGSRVLLIPMQPQADRPIAEQFAREWHQGSKGRAVPCRTELGLSGLLNSLAACRLLVGMRLHALILAAACGVPSAALAYDPKVTAFMEQSQQGDAVYDLEHPDREALAALLTRVWAERGLRAAALRGRLPGLRAAAERNVEIVLSLLPD